MSRNNDDKQLKGQDASYIASLAAQGSRPLSSNGATFQLPGNIAANTPIPVDEDGSEEEWLRGNVKPRKFDQGKRHEEKIDLDQDSDNPRSQATYAKGGVARSKGTEESNM